MRLCLCRSFFVGSGVYRSVGVGSWGVESHRGGGLGLPWIKLMCLEFARPCARGGFCDASGAEAG